MAQERRLPLAALGFAVAAALSSWTPLAAPFAIVVGLGAAVLAAVALRRGARRTIALSAAAVAALAIAAGVLVLARTAGVGREPMGAPVVPSLGRPDAGAQLDAAEQRTRESRDRARSELQKLGPPAEEKRSDTR